MVSASDTASFVRKFLLVLGACVVLIRLCDAALVSRFGCLVGEACTSASDSMCPDKAEDLVHRNQLCLVVASLGLAVYLVRFLMQLWQAREGSCTQ